MCKGDVITINACGRRQRVRIKKVLPEGYFLGVNLDDPRWDHIFRATALIGV